MKAVILAGGVGSRLHPISLKRPKPMARLLDKPLLHHILMLLKAHGITEVCLTLCYLPEQIREAFGGGEALGMRLHYVTEEEALGTAGGVRQCAGFLGGDDLLVISGDAACSFDLGALVRFHREKGAEVTLAVCRAEDPSEYGLVLFDEEGRIVKFTEKPSRAETCTDAVNTGIYVLSGKLVGEIPAEGPCDFAKDLFPALLREGRPLYAMEAEGYWCDVGSCRAYVKANRDALTGLLRLGSDAVEIAPGIRAASPVPPDVSLTAPCYIGENVTLGSGAQIGPDCVIGSGSRIGAGAVVLKSIVDGASLGRECRVEGAVLCEGCQIGNGSTLAEGCVLGDGCQIGDGSVLEPGLVLWPGKRVAPGRELAFSLKNEQVAFSAVFDYASRMRGDAVCELTGEQMRLFGSAAGRLGRTGAAFCGGNYAALAAEAYLAGAAACGQEVYRLDAGFEAAAAFSAKSFSFASVLFVRQTGRQLTLSFYDGRGLPCPRDFQRRLEQAASGTAGAAAAEEAGNICQISGCSLLQLAHLARLAIPIQKKERKTVSVAGRGAAARLLASALGAEGLFSTRAGAAGKVEYALSPDGFTLSAVAENGLSLSHEKLLAALSYAELAAGEGPLALPYSAPDVLTTIAERTGGSILRLQRDGEAAETLFAQKPWFYDALSLCIRLTTRLEVSGMTLSELAARLPRFYTAQTDVSAACGPGRLFDALGITVSTAELVSGIRLKSARGSARICPTGAQTYRVVAESYREEYAQELCADVEKKLRGASGG